MNPDGEKQDLDELRKAFKTGKSFDFSRLLNKYEIDKENPISVQLLGK